ncbi:protein kinase family protein [Actinomadura parmotrematis]|uniref:AMP-binding protein n=1 Tax=Actinomadura parmotrematis TaxID=2864039 RepID=A0ABS7G3X6_9ACTN|nr:protein kinase family protein [Actinomadura parmotrematis]MBW8487060.1 AMP-binding protein [Actinomadura parmotrematis]
MSTSVIEPGTRLAGRYRLEERISKTGGSSLWKAIDEILARAVAVRTFDPEFPRVAEVVTAARAASRLTDPRLTQVFDADDSGEAAYVVSEWVAGEPLEQMLAKAPLEPGRAATLLYEATEAIAAAHAAGLAHLCLTPSDLVWTTGGTVKVLGIAVDAVLCDRYDEDPAAEDVRGLGAMLYAALTARWPGDPEASALPAAPAAGGVPEPPRQVQAGIAQGVNDIVCRCVGIPLPGAEPITTPAGMARALRGVPRTPLPLFAGLGNAQPPAPRAPRPPSPTTTTPDATRPQHRPQRGSQHGSQHGQEQRQSLRQPPPAPPSQRTAAVPHGGGPRRSGPSNKLLAGIAAAALTVVVGITAFALSGGDDGKKAGPGTSAKPTATASTGPAKLDVKAVYPFEELTQGSPESGINEGLNALIDGDASTGTWHTSTFNGSDFGRLAKGFGVVLDLGGPHRVTGAKVASRASGAKLELRVGDGRTLAATKSAGSAQAQLGTVEIKADTPLTGRYVLVWFTTPAVTGFKAKMTEVSVYGTPAS